MLLDILFPFLESVNNVNGITCGTIMLRFIIKNMLHIVAIGTSHVRIKSRNNKSIHEYHSGFVNLSAECIELVYNNLKEVEIPTLQKFHKESQCDQFFVKLCKEFELVGSNLMRRIPTPSLNESCGEYSRNAFLHGDLKEDVHVSSIRTAFLFVEYGLQTSVISLWIKTSPESMV